MDPEVKVLLRSCLDHLNIATLRLESATRALQQLVGYFDKLARKLDEPTS